MMYDLRLFLSIFNVLFFLVMVISDSSGLGNLVGDLIRNILVSFDGDLFIDNVIDVFDSFNGVLFLSLDRDLSGSGDLNIVGLHLADHIDSLLLDHFGGGHGVLFRDLLLVHLGVSFFSVSGYWLLVGLSNSFRNVVKNFLGSDVGNLFNSELEMIVLGVSVFLGLGLISSVGHFNGMHFLDGDGFSHDLSFLDEMSLLRPLAFSDLGSMRKHGHLLFRDNITMSRSSLVSHVH